LSQAEFLSGIDKESAPVVEEVFILIDEINKYRFYKQ